ncbi:hypothetical protein, partial [Vibrio casei]|uniref:hypothetical protein n=2 Tax=Gammaproteobacteria TaxID=1236 RepID=UPI003F9438E2
KYFEDNAPVQDFDPDYELIIDEGRLAFKAEHLHESAGLGRFFKRVNDGDIAKGSISSLAKTLSRVLSTFRN